nr:hypothetical protein [Gammaproteobacteria bacterium]
MSVDRNALLAAAAAAAFVGLLAAESALVSVDAPLAAPAETSPSAALRIALGAEPGSRVSDANGGPECCNALSISLARPRASCWRARCCS